MVNKDRANQVINFIQRLHLTGDFYGQPFILQEWQREIIWNVYGTVKENGYRQYEYVYLEIPKKMGKTELVAAIGLNHLCCDGYSGQIYCCAAEREQAGLVYRAVKQMIEQDIDLENILRVVDSKKEIHNKITGTFLKVLSAEAYSKHGINPTVVIFDELHAQRNAALWEVMTAMAGDARQEPIWWVITTAGDDPDKNTIGWEIHEKAVQIRDGEKVDPTWYVKIYGAPEDADIYDEQVWYDCNPSLGVTISIEKVRAAALKARNSEREEKLFRWLRLNQWVSLKRLGWLPITLWDKTVSDWNPADLLGKKCYAGIDLASTTDIAAVACLFPPQEGIEDWRFILESFIPEDNMKERILRDHVPFDKWVKSKHITATQGDVIDYGYIKTHIEQLELKYEVKHYCGDPWHLEVLKQLIGGEIERKFVQIAQSMAGMSPSMHELERLFRLKEITHQVNPVGRWTFGNVVVAIDGNENMKPMKNKSIDRIDPICALIDAMAGAILLEPKISVYEKRGLVSL